MSVPPAARRLNPFERCLSLWVALCEIRLAVFRTVRDRIAERIRRWLADRQPSSRPVM